MMTALAVPGGLMRPDYDEGDAAAAQARALAGDADVQRRASSDTIPPGRLSASWATPTSAVLGGGGWPILVSRARDGASTPGTGGPSYSTTGPRSEERRVGKECRSRWSPYH